MITTINSARTYAEKLVQKFYEDHKTTIEAHRKTGDISFVLNEELSSLRKTYLAHVSQEIGYRQNIFNMALLKVVFKKQ
jgi:hypothetical protein